MNGRSSSGVAPSSRVFTASRTDFEVSRISGDAVGIQVLAGRVGEGRLFARKDRADLRVAGEWWVRRERWWESWEERAGAVACRDWEARTIVLDLKDVFVALEGGPLALPTLSFGFWEEEEYC